MSHRLVRVGNVLHVELGHPCPHCGRVAVLRGPIGAHASWYCVCGNALYAVIPNVYLEDA